MATLAVVLLYVGYSKGEGQHLNGLKYAYRLLIQILPLLLCAFIVAGMMNELIPREKVAQFVGKESGWTGILIGAVAGSFTPGGPFICMPIAAGMVHAGAAIGPAVAYLTSWSLLAFTRMPLEVGLLGWKLTAIKFVSGLFLPLLAGGIAQLFFNHVNLTGK